MLRKAKTTDAKEIQSLVNSFADRGEMLHRSLNELYENVRDYFVIEADGKIIGCCALHVNWGDLGEVKALAVADEAQGQGFGKVLIAACVEEAGSLGLVRLYTLTYKPDFFRKLGFSEIDKAQLPQKVWSECIHCPKFPDCGEIALVYPLQRDDAQQELGF